MQRSKDLTFIGFSIKSRKIVLGCNALLSERKRKYLIILCHSAAKNTVKAITAYAYNHDITIIKTHNILLEEIVNKSNCKAAAITDQKLAAAIKDNLSGNFEIMEGGVFNEYSK